MPPDAQDLRSPDAVAIERALASIVTRTVMRQAIQAAAVAVGLAGILCAVLRNVLPASGIGISVAVGLGAAALLGWQWRRPRTLDAASRLIERKSPDCRNVVITAAELLRHPDRATPRMRARVWRDAAARASAIAPRRVVPLGHSAGLLAGALMIPLVAAGAVPRGVTGGGPEAPGTPAAGERAGSATLTVTARIEPPAYTGLARRELVNPERIEAVEGSELSLSLRGDGEWRIRFGSVPLETTRAKGETAARTILSQSGYLAIESASGTPVPPRLMAVAVTSDRAPVVRIDRPGRDLLLPDARAHIAVSAAATDDFGLASLELRYTRVSGSGEQFDFAEGTLPVALAREGDQSWKAQADIPLSTLKLDPGDVLVYRAVARDRRPGERGVATSDTYFIEIAAPGQVALEGFALPPDRERYALSQQMILLKLQRLQAREPSLPRPKIVDETSAIAAEQRAVRANFIFLMGGTVEDEEVEAEQSHEIQEGRLENTARKEISTAIHHMTRVEQALAAVSTRLAIPAAKAAVEALQRAFGRNRYILRMLSARSRIDPSRRLTGELGGASDWQRELLPASLDRETREARGLLADLLSLAAAVAGGRPLDPGSLEGLPERALAIGPAAGDWQQTSKRLSDLRDAVAARRPAADLVRILDDVIPIVLRHAEQSSRSIPGAGVEAPGALLGAWAGREKRP